MTKEELILWFFAIYGGARFFLDISGILDWWIKKLKGGEE